MPFCMYCVDAGSTNLDVFWESERRLSEAGVRRTSGRSTAVDV